MSSAAPADQSATTTTTTSTTLRRTVADVDMVGYSDAARNLEQNIGPQAVAELNQQIQSFINRSLAMLPDVQAFCVVARTGDGAILLFEYPEHAHRSAHHVHVLAKEHNDFRSERSAERWFRIGLATGEVNSAACIEGPTEYAGTTIATAVRLQTAAKDGEILVDAPTFAALTPASKALYAPQETVSGKRDETFRAHRCCVSRRPSQSKNTIGLPCRVERSSVLALGHSPPRPLGCGRDETGSIKLRTPSRRSDLWLY